jgi:hypothetical protein
MPFIGGNTYVGTALIKDELVIQKASGEGIKVDVAAPTFGWRDITGDITPRAGGGAAPAFTAYRGGNTLAYAYAVGDVVDMKMFHIPHDYAPGTDIFIHLHWGHNGTAIAGTFTATLKAMWCKGFNQAGNIFGAEVTPVITEVVTNIAGHPRWGHFVTETPLTSAGGSATTIDRGLLEVDGVFLVSLVVSAIPTITGGVTNAPYIFTCDLHYQSTNIATKGKAPNFYV